ncbi:MAG: endolytic transglycosylase MltG [Paramuribaculum sp.]|jgi:UPF0755 protein
MAQNQPVKKRTPRASAKKGGDARRRLLWIGGITIIVALVIAGVAAGMAMHPYKGNDTWLYIPRDATEKSMADSLRARLGSAEANRIMTFFSAVGGEPRRAAGAYLIRNGQRTLSISRNLARGMQTPVRVSWNSARTLQQLADIIASQLDFTAEEFLQACKEELPAQGYKAPEFMAAFLPDSYEFYWTTTPEAAVRRMTQYRDRFWTDDRREKARKLGLTPVEVATLASIVEEESAKPDEYPAIARLYMNRLKKGMLLQADPTVKYATGNFALRRITGEHLRTPSPYNTYLHPGLPPGPLRTPSKSTIDRVLSAPAHTYLYMCAKEDFSGYHNFASDYATHTANARRYQKELNRRGIK